MKLSLTLFPILSLFLTRGYSRVKRTIPIIGKSKEYLPKTPNQKTYVNYLCDKNVSVIVGLGPAGCGKTLFACNQGVKEFKDGQVQKLILTRPIVSVDEELGYLPGSILQKMDPWTRPIFDILEDFYSNSQIQTMIQNGVIEISPLAYMRGRTFKNAFIIADEMQNSSPNQMLMLATRLGEGSRMVITGDLAQSDRSTDNGLSAILEKIKRYEKNNQINNIRYIEMNQTDVQRSNSVSEILGIYDYEPPIIKPLIQTKDKLWDIFDNDAALIPKSYMPKNGEK